MGSRRKRPTSPPAPAPEAAYRRAFAEHGNAEIRLDWRRLRQRRWTGLASPDGDPALWPGSLYLFRPEELQEENNRYINEWTPPAAKNRMLFIGGNAAGIVYALDGEGRVIAFDELEAADQDPRLGQVLADSLEELLAAREDTP